ncbi:MAG: hypothetical protein KIT84_06925 [Labilithrix sp.]|nr:hypothetical protein [Labilithrix sp.]MCW5810727.1 hypothetical protein [Labilithrix sp.]
MRALAPSARWPTRSACVFALGLASSASVARAAEGEPPAPLRFAHHARETRVSAGLTASRSNDTRDVSRTGLQLGLVFGAFPQLRWWRAGGASGAMLRADDKSLLLTLPYVELTGGVRLSVLEAYAFVGVSWLTAGVARARFAIGGAAPRAGVACGVQTSAVAVHAFAATEYHPFVLGSDDVRSLVFGLSAALIERPSLRPRSR